MQLLVCSGLLLKGIAKVWITSPKDLSHILFPISVALFSIITVMLDLPNNTNEWTVFYRKKWTVIEIIEKQIHPNLIILKTPIL